MTPRARPAWVYDLALVTATLLWGVNLPVSKAALAEADPLVFNALKFTLSVVVLGFLAAREHRISPAPAPRGLQLWISVFFLGFFGHFAYQMLFILGLARTTSGYSALLVNTSPLWTALLVVCLRLERLRLGAWAGLALSFGGSALVVFATAASGQISMVGNLLTVAAAVVWSFYTVLNKPLMKRASPTWLAFSTMACALPWLWVAAVPRLAATRWSEFGPVFWGAVLFGGVFSSGISYWLWNLGIRHVGPAQTSVYTYLVPLIAIALGFLWLGEPISGQQLVGGGLILGGLVVMRRARGYGRPSMMPSEEPSALPRGRP